MSGLAQQFLHYLDGMFAFVIHDKIKNDTFYCARQGW